MKFKKSTRFLLSLCLMTLTFLCGGNKAWGQTATTLFLEDFGSTTANTILSSYSGYSATSEMFTTGTAATNYSSDGKIGRNSTNPSSYDGASGLSAVFQGGTANTTNTVFKVTNIKIENYDDLNLYFGCWFGNVGHTVDVSYIIDNGTETSLTLDTYEVTTSNQWLYLSGKIPTTGKSLTLIFKHTPSKGWTMRLDDIKVTGVASVTTPAPTFSLEGGNYNGPQHVTITAPEGYTEGIVYTTDGTDPTTSSTVTDYTESGIDINATTTLRAVAYDSEMNFSGEAKATYTITYNAPTFSLASGTYYGDQSVSISVANLGSGSILYTTDGTDPKTNGTKYTEAITLRVGSTPTLKAVAKYGEGLFSDVTEATYDIQKASSTFFQRITSAAELTENSSYLIVCESESVAFGEINSSSKGTPQTVTITDGMIDLSTDGTGTPTEFILEVSGSNYKLKNASTEAYINTPSSTDIEEAETGTDLTITFNSDGTANIVGISGRCIRFGISQGVFGNYSTTNTTGYADVYLYKKHVISDFSFSDTEDLTASLPTSALADQTVILDRKVYEGWNTFCVPFALTQAQLEEAYGSGAVAKYLSGVTTEGENATLHFTPETDGGIEANKAYLLYLTADVTEAKTFSGVTLEPAGTCTTTVSTESGDYTFQGILKPTTLTTDDTQYFLNSAGTNFVLPSNSTSAMKATRAYITVPAASGSAQGRQYSFDFNGTTTGIDNVNISGLEDGAWYTISGIRVNRPAAKGVYIHNGRKVIVK
ncbi:MAG: chitobiase/beta-hexosaminidase C-terminal domain-containing protein [Alloprevotella sp.]